MEGEKKELEWRASRPPRRVARLGQRYNLQWDTHWARLGGLVRGIGWAQIRLGAAAKRGAAAGEWLGAVDTRHNLGRPVARAEGKKSTIGLGPAPDKVTPVDIRTMHSNAAIGRC
jgi:hypothetical protein